MILWMTLTLKVRLRIAELQSSGMNAGRWSPSSNRSVGTCLFRFTCVIVFDVGTYV